MSKFHPFPNTHWSLVKRAGLNDHAARKEALQALLERYLPALRSFLWLTRKIPDEEADELLQAFIAEIVLDKDLIGQADRTKGRFRSLLMASLRNFSISRFRVQTRRTTECLDHELHQDGEPSAELLVQAAWAKSLVHGVIETMKVECEATGRMDVWHVFDERILQQIFGRAKPYSYEVLARRLNLESPTQAANLLVTGKRMYARLLRAAVAEYEMEPSDIDNEITDLWQILAESPAYQDETRSD